MKLYIEIEELRQRIFLNFDHLKNDPYYGIDQVFSPADYSWQGDKEGRALLAFASHYRISGEKIPCMDLMLEQMPAKLNRDGYFGPLYQGNIHEEQLSGHSWLLRGLCEHYQAFGDAFSLASINSIVRNLYLPLTGKIATYPIIRSESRKGGVSGEVTENLDGWVLSSDIGRLQAEACAERLKDAGIQKIYSSSQGRAKETAEYTARKLGLTVEPVDFIRELAWGSKTEKPIFKDGHPWFVVDDMVLKGENILDRNWEATDRFSSSVVGERAKTVTAGIDEWLKTLGYEREGDYYRVTGHNTNQTVAMFSHAGSSSAALSHMLSAAFPWVFQVIRLDFTSVTVIDLGDEYGTLTFPRLTLLNDARHIEGIDSSLFFGN